MAHNTQDDRPPARRAAGALGTVVLVADATNYWVGRTVAWMTLGTVLVCFATVYLRYAVGISYIWLQEVYVWQHIAVILLGAGYTMMTGGFVRVDIFYAKWPPRRRAVVDMAMTVLLLAPFLAVFGWFAWTFVANSVSSDEGSMNPGGLPNLWLLKATLIGFVVLIGLQGLSFIARGLLVLRGREDFAHPLGGHGDQSR